MTLESSFLGLEGRLEIVQIEGLIFSLRTAWTATIGEEPSNLEDDLEACRRWFDPVAQGQRLRRELGALTQLPGNITDPGPPLTFAVGAGKWLVTPEGRCALDLLERLPPDQTTYVIGESQLLPYERRLGTMYREWSRHRLRSVVALLEGTTKPLQIPAAGVVIALLVNRCTSESRALTRFASGRPRDVVDRAFFASVQAFSDVLAPRRRSRRDPRLVSGWMLYEAGRRLGDGLVVLDARAGQDGKVWIRPAAVSDVIEVVTRDLVRGHRARVTTERFGEAFDALVTELRRELPRLAGFGLVHERPVDTQRLRNQLMERLEHHVAAPS